MERQDGTHAAIEAGMSDHLSSDEEIAGLAE